MKIIVEQGELEALCAAFAEAPYVTVDTEFMRERTYWPILCLVQIARPGDDEGDAAIIDPVAGDLDLAPLFALMTNPDVVKVFHAARQDVEIFHKLGGVIPQPMFDTQVAAMVCGYGEQVGYETLVRRIAKTGLDKSSRFTDWSRRPLSEKQLVYALGDVTHLRVIYEKLSARLKESGRAEWVAEEMAVLTSEATYVNEPEDAWRRLKTRSSDPRFLAAARALAAWREREAQARDVPRSRVLKDDALLEVASNRPATAEALAQGRLATREARKPDTVQAILAALAEAAANPLSPADMAPKKAEPPPGSGGLIELLKVLLKARSEATGVAQKLIATSADIEALASEDAPDIAVLSGWRREVFGDDALRLKRGEIALTSSRSGVVTVDIPAG